MTIPSWLRSLNQRFARTPAPRKHPARRPRRVAALRVEPLEERRLLNAGGVDPIFGQGGTVLPGGPTGAGPTYLAVQPGDNKIVVAGLNADGVGVLARYTPDGQPDPTFDGDGVQTVALVNFDLPGSFASGPGFTEAGQVLALQGNKVIVVGNWGNGQAVARYNADGSPDTTFGLEGTGRQTFTFGSPFLLDFVRSVAVQPDGKILVAGYSCQSELAVDFDFALARFNENGTPDTSFGVNGKQYIDFNLGGHDAPDDRATSVAVLPDGKVVAAGYSFQELVGWCFAVARLDENGQPDQTFGVNGRQIVQVNDQGFAVGTGVVAQPGNKLVVAGYALDESATSIDFALARLDEFGNLDGTFGEAHDGTQTVNFGPDTNAIGLGLAQAGGKLIVAGYSPVPFGSPLVRLARLSADGIPDATFGDGGKVTGGPGLATGFGVQAGGDIVVAGGMPGAVLARFIGNVGPIAQACGPYSVSEGAGLALDASASADSDGDALTTPGTSTATAPSATLPASARRSPGPSSRPSAWVTGRARSTWPSAWTTATATRPRPPPRSSRS